MIRDLVLADVGNITKVTILTRGGDGVLIWYIKIDNNDETLFYFREYGGNGIPLKYNDGGPQYDGCEYVTVNFINGTSDNFYFDGTQLGGDPCPYLTQYSFPTVEPSLSPTIPSINPTLLPTLSPTLS